MLGGSVTVDNSQLAANSVDGSGGAIYITGGSLTITNSHISDNNAEISGGALSSYQGASAPNITISGSTFWFNRAYEHGGALDINNGTTLSVTNSVFSTNAMNDFTGTGRALHQEGSGITSSFTHVTITNHDQDSVVQVSGTLNFYNSIIYGNPSSDSDNPSSDCVGTLNTNTRNIIGTGTCGTPYSTADPLLTGLWVRLSTGGLYFGLLQSGSPAIDAADSTYCPSTDILGTSRPQGSACDIGAYEYDSSNPPYTVTPNITATPTVAPSATATPTVAPSATATPTTSGQSLAAPQNLTVSSTGLISWNAASGATHYELETYETDGYYNISYQINAVTHPDYYYLPSTQTSVQLRSTPIDERNVYSNFRVRARALTSTSQSAWVYYPSETTTVTLDLSSQNIPTHSNSLACPSNVQFSWNWDDGKLHLTVSQDQLSNAMYYEVDIEYQDSNGDYASGAVLVPVDQFATPLDNRLITRDFETDYTRYEVTVSYLSSSSLKPMCQVGNNLREDHLTFTQDDIPAPPPPPAPTNLSVSGTTTTSLTLNWDAVTGATSYKVFLDGTEQPLNVGGTSHSFTNLTPGTSYNLGVAAVVGTGGGTSATASITASTAIPPTPTVNATCTLANAITAANTDTATGGCPAGSGADTITLTENITLSAALPVISSDITIEGGGNTIDGDNSFGIFRITSGNFSINNLTLTRGTGFPSGTDNRHVGGAIFFEGNSLTITDSVFSNNSARANSALRVTGTDNQSVTIQRSHFLNNTASSFGDTVFFWNSVAKTIVQISDSVFNNNSANSNDSTIGIGRNSDVSISNSVFTSNSNSGSASSTLRQDGTGSSSLLTNVVITGNSNGARGVVDLFDGTMTMKHVTISGNSPSNGAGLSQTGGTLNIFNSVIYGNGSSDCAGTLNTNMRNIIGTGNCGTAYSTSDPLLGSLVSPTDGSIPYIPLQSGSPAIDAADSTHCPSTDIRGTSRPQGSHCDIGAYEYDSSSPPPTVDPNITPTTPPTVDPNITPTTAPTATDTPDDEVVLIEFGDFKLTLQDFLDIGTYHPGILPEDQMKLDELISNFNIDWGTAGGAFWNAGVALTKWLGSQFMCGAIKTLGKLAVRVGVFTVTQVGGRAILTASAQTLKILLQGTSIATSIPVSVPKGATIGGLWGSTFAGVGAVIGAPAGGITLSAVGGWFAHQIALSIAVDILTQSLTTLQGIRQKQAMTDAVAQAIHETEGGTYESAHAIALTIVNAAEFEREFHSLVSYWQFQGGDATPSLTSNVGVGFSNLFANVGGVVLSELLFKKLYNSLLSTALGRQSELDCSNVATIDNLETEFTNAAQAFGVDELLEMGKIVALNYADDLYHFLTVTIRTKLEQLSNLADTIASATSIDPPLMVKSVCQFHGILPVFGAAGDLVCNPIVQPGLVRAICLVPLPTIMIGTRTFGRGSCDDLSSIIPEKTRAQISEKFKVIWDAVPGATNYLISWRLFSSPAGPWREIIVPGNVTSYQLTTRELPRSASGFQLRVQTVKDDVASDPVLYPADPNDPTQFAAAPAIIVHENVPAPPAEDSDDRDDSGAAATSIPQAEPPASTCENLPPHLRVQHYHHSTQCNVLSRASVGHPDLVGNFIAGVDIWGYVGAVVEVCIQGSGPLRFVDTSEMPRSVRPLPAFSDGGLTCAWVERVGQVILVPGPPSPPKLKPATPGPATQALSNCMVTLEYVLNFRQGPGGPIRKTADGRDFWLPALVSLTALERTADWFYVDYHGERGWISADFVIERGDCQANAAPSLPTALPAWEPSPLPANPTAPAPDVTPVGMR